MKIFVIDDEKNQRLLLSDYFNDLGYITKTLSCYNDFIHEIRLNNLPDIIISDYRLGDKTGEDILKYINKNVKKKIFFIMITAYGTIENAVNAIKIGAYDYISKPVNLEEIGLKIERINKEIELINNNIELNEKIDKLISSELFISESPASRKILELIKKASAVDYPVLITGETGVGKEVAAQAIHKLSPRSTGKFIPVNCAALPRELAESELFGSEKGAFTGSISLVKGKFEESDKGTILLDEIGEMPFDLQTKLLRAIETKKINRIGSSKEIDIDIRVIAATNRNLEDQIKAGKFRKDLYYRLNVIRIDIPPIRDRPEDITALTNYFIAKEFPEQLDSIDMKLIDSLQQKEWKGNVRELFNYLRMYFLFPETKTNIPDRELKTLKEIENDYILKILKYSGNSIAKAAKILGVHRNTLSNKLKEIE